MDLVLEEDAPVGVFNVSTGEGRSILEVFKAVANYLEMDAPNVPVIPAGKDDVSQVILDPNVTEKIFGWKAEVSFNQTIVNQLRWYDVHGINSIYSHLSHSNNAMPAAKQHKS
jgi:nucleoside-diphosphate-sugar epimerase